MLFIETDSDSEYYSSCGWALRRESGKTPNGNPINMRWVLRDAQRNFVDVDQYRHDIAARHNLKLQSQKGEHMKPANQPRTFKCQRPACGYEWVSRLPEPQMPRACPGCLSRRWNIKRK